MKFETNRLYLLNLPVITHFWAYPDLLGTPSVFSEQLAG